MTTKEYLLSVRRLDNLINDKLDEIYRLKTRATHTTIACDNERVQGTSNQDKQGDIVSEIIDLEKDVDMLVDIQVDIKRNIKHICKQLNPKHRDMLIKKYIEYKSISTIADEFGMKIRGTKKAHKRAIEEFEKIYLTTRYSISLDRTLQDVVE